MQYSAVSRDECKVIVNKKHAVQLLWSNTGGMHVQGGGACQYNSGLDPR